MAYERALGRALANYCQPGARFGPTELEAPRVYLGPWFEFEDEAGPGHAQADAVVVDTEAIWILEAKLSQTASAWAQLIGLYAPLVQAVWPAPRYCLVQVCKNLRERPGDLATGPGELVHGATWHWLGNHI